MRRAGLVLTRSQFHQTCRSQVRSSSPSRSLMAKTVPLFYAHHCRRRSRGRARFRRIPTTNQCTLVNFRRFLSAIQPPIRQRGRLRSRPTRRVIGSWWTPAGATVASSQGGTPTSAFAYTFPVNDSGTYTVGWTAIGGSTVELEFRVNAPPVAQFTNTAPGGNAPQSIDFTSTSTDDFGLLAQEWNLNTLWDWGGDGDLRATGSRVTQRYAGPGTYVVTLTVTDIDNVSSTTTEVVTIPGTPAMPDPPVWSGNQVKFTPVPGATGYRVTLVYTGKNADGSTCAQPIERSVPAGGPHQVTAAANGCADPEGIEASVAVIANGVVGASSIGVSQ